MKIAIIVSSTKLWWGAEHSSLLLAQWLTKSHDVTLISFYTVNQSYNTSWINHICLWIKYWKWALIKFINACIIIPYKLYKQYKKACFELIIVNWADAIFSHTFVATLRTYPMKRIAVLRNHKDTIPAIARKIYLYWLIHAHKRVAISQWLADAYKETWIIHVIYNPIDISHYQICWSVNNMNTKSRQLLYLWRLERIKQPHLILEYMAALLLKDRKYHMTVVWDGSLKEELTEQTKHRDLDKHITFVWIQQNIAPYLQQADLLILTSKAETFGRVIVEAMANWVPVAAHNCPYWPAEIIDDKVFTQVSTVPYYGKFWILLSPNDIRSNVEFIDEYFTNKKVWDKYNILWFKRAKDFSHIKIVDQRVNFLEQAHTNEFTT